MIPSPFTITSPIPSTRTLPPPSPICTITFTSSRWQNPPQFSPWFASSLIYRPSLIFVDRPIGFPPSFFVNRSVGFPPSSSIDAFVFPPSVFVVGFLRFPPSFFVDRSVGFSHFLFVDRPVGFPPSSSIDAFVFPPSFFVDSFRGFAPSFFVGFMPSYFEDISRGFPLFLVNRSVVFPPSYLIEGPVVFLSFSVDWYKVGFPLSCFVWSVGPIMFSSVASSMAPSVATFSVFLYNKSQNGKRGRNTSCMHAPPSPQK